MSHLHELISGAVTEVKTDIYVTSFGPVSDVEMVSKLRMSWVLLHSRAEIHRK